MEKILNSNQGKRWKLYQRNYSFKSDKLGISLCTLNMCVKYFEISISKQFIDNFFTYFEIVCTHAYDKQFENNESNFGTKCNIFFLSQLRSKFFHNFLRFRSLIMTIIKRKIALNVTGCMTFRSLATALFRLEDPHRGLAQNHALQKRDSKLLMFSVSVD